MRHCLGLHATSSLYPPLNALLQGYLLIFLFVLEYCHDAADDAGMLVTIINPYLLTALEGLELTNNCCGVT